MPKKDLYWLAGLLEGEGCFRLSESMPGYKYARITLAMSDRDVVLRTANLFKTKVNGPYCYGTNRKPWWSTTACAKTAIDLMKRLHPLMGRRRAAKIKSVLSKVSK